MIRLSIFIVSIIALVLSLYIKLKKYHEIISSKIEKKYEKEVIERKNL